MEISNLITHIEALIFASEKPLTTLELTDLVNNAFGFMEDKIMLDQVESAIEGIIEKYNAEFYPFEVRESGGGWQFLTKKDFHKTVAQLNGDKFLKRLSTAAMETLAIVCYKQPVTKADIEAIRGVSSDYAIQKLLEKDLVVITGRNENLPGHPLVYATSKNFMDYFGINSPEDLPQLKDVYDETIVEATRMSGEAAGEETEMTSETGHSEITASIENTGDQPATDTTEEALPGEDSATGAENNEELTHHEAREEKETAEGETTYEDATDEDEDTTTEEEVTGEETEAEMGEAETGSEEEEPDEENDALEEDMEEEEESADEEDETAEVEEDDDQSNGFRVGEDGELIEDDIDEDDIDEEDDDEEDDPEKDKGEPG